MAPGNAAEGKTLVRERIDVQTCVDLFQVALHNQRYQFALDQMPHMKSPLEIGTGAGSLSAVLATRCENYVGLEYDAQSCLATLARTRPGSRIVRGDARWLPFRDQGFSEIICLEVLEHLGDFKAGIRGIRRCLKPEGMAVISVPYRRLGGRSEINRYHPYEPGEGELTEYFRQCFRQVSVYYQYFEETALMRLARCCHLRRLFGIDRIYRDLTEGRPEAVARLKISPQANGMKLHLLVTARDPKPTGEGAMN
jgi:ubiquinone/menaquinone biosynthesis C-methylase UbiE